MKRLLTLLFVIILIFIAGHIPFGKKITMYKAVDKDQNEQYIQIWSNMKNIKAFENYATLDNKLFLKIQKIGNGFIGQVILSKQKWDIEKLNKFRKNNPELKKYYPDPKLVNSGIEWIKD